MFIGVGLNSRDSFLCKRSVYLQIVPWNNQAKKESIFLEFHGLPSKVAAYTMYELAKKNPFAPGKNAAPCDQGAFSGCCPGHRPPESGSWEMYSTKVADG